GTGQGPARTRSLPGPAWRGPACSVGSRPEALEAAPSGALFELLRPARAALGVCPRHPVSLGREWQSGLDPPAWAASRPGRLRPAHRSTAASSPTLDSGAPFRAPGT